MRLPKLSGARLRTTIKFAIFAAVGIFLLAVLAKLIGNLQPFSSNVTYRAAMSDVTGLASSDDVKVAGVTVGEVGSIQVQHGHALVTFTVDKNVHLPTSTQDGLRWRNVLGEKYLYLYPGSTGPQLAPGSTIPLDQSISGGEVDDFLNALGPFLKAINPQEANAFVAAVVGGLQGNQGRVSDLIDNTAVVSQALGNLNAQVGSLVDNLDTVLSALASRNGDLNRLVDNLASVSQTLANRNDTLDSAVVDFAQLAGQFKTLISTNRGNLDAAINNLQSIANVLSQHHGDLQASLSTLSTGLAPYFQISSYGQWFQIRAVYLCLANETTCAADAPPVPGLAPGSGLGGGASPATGASGAASPGAGGSGPAEANPAVSQLFDFAVNGTP